MHAPTNAPIIASLLDTDFYKFTMAMLAWLKHRGVLVTYGFNNRTKKVRLADRVSEKALRAELDHARSLRFTAEEIAYLRSLGVFREDFLAFLATVALPPYELSAKDGQYAFTTTGAWPEAIFWETLFLSIVNELHYRAEIRDRFGIAKQYLAFAMAMQDGEQRLNGKIERLAKFPAVRFVEFGTRRRFSRAWQEHVTRSLAARLPQQLVGTSNVLLAKSLGLKPVGTYAHELPMVYAALCRDDRVALRQSPMHVLYDLLEQYEGKIAIYGLTDTFGSESFYEDLPSSIAARLAGFRLDSGDPVVDGERGISCLKRCGVAAESKGLFPSDGLDDETMIGLHAHFDGRIGTGFGWGTNATNDLGYPPLSLVVKAIAADGIPTVKLSNNPSKATGPDDEVAYYKDVFGYREGQARECVY